MCPSLQFQYESVKENYFNIDEMYLWLPKSSYNMASISVGTGTRE